MDAKANLGEERVRRAAADLVAVGDGRADSGTVTASFPSYTAALPAVRGYVDPVLARNAACQTAYYRAVHRGDICALMDCFAADAVVRTMNGVYVGSDQVRDFYLNQAMHAMLSNLSLSSR
jgi:hypothetical protein